MIVADCRIVDILKRIIEIETERVIIIIICEMSNLLFFMNALIIIANDELIVSETNRTDINFVGLD